MHSYLKIKFTKDIPCLEMYPTFICPWKNFTSIGLLPWGCYSALTWPPVIINLFVLVYIMEISNDYISKRLTECICNVLILAAAGKLMKYWSTPSIKVSLHVFLREWDSGWTTTDNAANTASMRLSISCNLEVVPEDVSSCFHLCSPIYGATHVRVSSFMVLVQRQLQLCSHADHLRIHIKRTNAGYKK